MMGVVQIKHLEKFETQITETEHYGLEYLSYNQSKSSRIDAVKIRYNLLQGTKSKESFKWKSATYMRETYLKRKKM